MRRALILLLFVLPGLSNFLFAQNSIPYYGIQTHFGQGRADLDSVLLLIKEAGIGAIRDEVYWSAVETVRDTFKFKPEHDAYVQGALAKGLKPLIILDYGNDLYGGTPRDSAGRAAFARYCKAVVGRYAQLGVKHYEIWNEPNLCITGFCPWNPGPNPSEYLELLKSAYAACKAVDPSVYIVGCSTSPLDEPQTNQKIPGVEFIKQVFNLGGGAYMDAVSFHQYPIGRAPEQWVSYETGRIQAVVGTKPMWITEVGYPTNLVTEDNQANIIARTYLLGKTIPQLQRISWYDLQNDCTDPGNAECRYGILREDRSMKPAYKALKTVATVIGSQPLLNMDASGGSYLLSFGSSQQPVYAAWHESSTASKYVALKTPYVAIIDRDGGKKISILPDNSITVSLTQNPQYIVTLSSAPALKKFQITPKRILLDSTQSYEMNVSGEDSASIPVSMAPGTIKWTFIGTGGTVDSLGVFHATGKGTGKLVGSYQSFTDTCTVSIVAVQGSFLISDFLPGEQWPMTMLNLDSTSSSFTISTDRASVGTSSGKLKYTFRYSSTLGLQQYRALLQAQTQLPGRPDSIAVDVFGDGNQHRLEFRFVDAFGEVFSKTAADQPVTWDGIWKPVRIYLKSFGSAFDYPVTLDRVTVYCVVNFPKNDSLYSGTIYLDNLRSTYTSTSGVNEEVPIPFTCDLEQNYPNPFNPSTQYTVHLREESKVTLKIFDVVGREVVTLLSEKMHPGVYTIPWNAAHLPTGVYFARLSTGNETRIKKTVLAK